MSVSCPDCGKTCTSRECAELFSLFSSFDGDCQSGSFLIRRNRDRLSTRKPDVGVFTQSVPIADIRRGCSHSIGKPHTVQRACPLGRIILSAKRCQECQV